jgi:hypothetical protein
MPKEIFALSNRSVERRHDGWYYGNTYGMEPKDFKGPYCSMASVTLMLAREITRELVRRQERLARALASSPAE